MIKEAKKPKHANTSTKNINMAHTIDKFILPRDTKVSPLAHSMPNKAQMSPAYTS